ncbi:MAG: hypothetical protein LIP05_05890 [Tannerellaceae bacterium]|nr:hypothetical protein [Tannerellaceae bacterium]
MKIYIRSILYACTIGLVTGCSDSTRTGDTADEQVLLEGIALTLQEPVTTTPSSRATSDYVVNTGNDPTSTLTGRETWELDVIIYNADGSFGSQSGTFTWDSGNSYWIPITDIFFPNYTRQEVQVNLHPAGWTTIDPDQSTDILDQDVLIENGDTSITVYPAHIPEIEVKHAHSMLDFRLADIDGTELSSVSVEIDNITYEPYEVSGTTLPEYLLIISVGSSSPVIRVSTTGGANYFQTTIDKITNTAVNTCYCFTLQGLELALAEITIQNWATGPGISGDYTSETSYPTFRGPAGESATLFFDNGLEQTIVFDAQGEYTGKPAGRTIIHIKTAQKDTPLSPPIVLGTTIIDLSSYF